MKQNKLLFFLKCDWASKKFFIRSFLFVILILNIYKVYVSIMTKNVETGYALGMMGFVTALIGIYKVSNNLESKVNNYISEGEEHAD